MKDVVERLVGIQVAIVPKSGLAEIGNRWQRCLLPAGHLRFLVMFDHRPKALARHHRHGHGLGVGLLTVADRQLDLHRIEQDDPGHVPFLVRLTSWWRQTAGPTTREKSPLIGLDVSARIRAIQDQWLAANDRGCNLRSGLQPH